MDSIIRHALHTFYWIDTGILLILWCRTCRHFARRSKPYHRRCTRPTHSSEDRWRDLLRYAMWT